MLKTLKILHTSDWHFGIESWSQTVPTDRTPEICSILNKILEVSEREEVDLFLITGDVFHSRTNPGVDTIRHVLGYLTKMAKIAPVVVLLGNHDWKGMIPLGRFLKETTPVSSNVVVLGIDPVEVEARRGQKVRILPLPYLDKGLGLEDRVFAEGERRINEFVEEKLREYRETSRGEFTVFMGHFTLRGLEPPGMETGREIIVPRELLPTSVDYIALGHIHELRRVEERGLPLTFYAGSLIRLDFSEEKDRKGAVLVTLRSNGDHTYEILDTSPKPLKTFVFERLDYKALELLERTCGVFDGYVRVQYLEDPKGLALELLNRLRGKVVKVEMVRKRRQELASIGEGSEELRPTNLMDLYKEFVREKYGEQANDLVNLVGEMLKEVEER